MSAVIVPFPSRRVRRAAPAPKPQAIKRRRNPMERPDDELFDRMMASVRWRK